MYNPSLSPSSFDFYTAGYSGLHIDTFIQKLKDLNIATLVDVRYMPVSRFRPEYSKRNLETALNATGICYLHKREWGVPKEIRSCSVEKIEKNDIWNWYDAHIMPDLLINFDEFFNSIRKPFVMMCLEQNPLDCHRHRISSGLTKIGYKGCDLSELVLDDKICLVTNGG